METGKLFLTVHDVRYAIFGFRLHNVKSLLSHQSPTMLLKKQECRYLCLELVLLKKQECRYLCLELVFNIQPETPGKAYGGDHDVHMHCSLVKCRACRLHLTSIDAEKQS